MAERPIRLFPRPHPIDVTAAIPDAPPMLFRWRKVVHRIVRAEGPERISPEWWLGANDETGDDRVRDYYRVESVHGMRFWVFREGLYGGEHPPRWYLRECSHDPQVSSSRKLLAAIRDLSTPAAER